MINSLNFEDDEIRSEIINKFEITKEKAIYHINNNLLKAKKSFEMQADNIDQLIFSSEIECKGVAFFCYEMGLFTLEEYMTISKQLSFIKNQFSVSLDINIGE